MTDDTIDGWTLHQTGECGENCTYCQIELETAEPEDPRETKGDLDFHNDREEGRA